MNYVRSNVYFRSACLSLFLGSVSCTASNSDSQSKNVTSAPSDGRMKILWATPPLKSGSVSIANRHHAVCWYKSILDASDLNADFKTTILATEAVDDEGSMAKFQAGSIRTGTTVRASWGAQDYQGLKLRNQINHQQLDLFNAFFNAVSVATDVPNLMAGGFWFLITDIVSIRSAAKSLKDVAEGSHGGVVTNFDDLVFAIADYSGEQMKDEANWKRFYSECPTAPNAMAAIRYGCSPFNSYLEDPEAASSQKVLASAGSSCEKAPSGYSAPDFDTSGQVR